MKSTKLFLRVALGNRRYAKCKKYGHEQANNADECKCITQCSKDSASNPEPIVITREKCPLSWSESRLLSNKWTKTEIHLDTDIHVLMMSSKFNSVMNIEIVKLSYACNLPFFIMDHDQFAKVCNCVGRTTAFKLIFCCRMPWDRVEL